MSDVDALPPPNARFSKDTLPRDPEDEPPPGEHWLEAMDFPIYNENADGTYGSYSARIVQYRRVGVTENGLTIWRARELSILPPRDAQRFGERIWE